MGKTSRCSDLFCQILSGKKLKKGIVASGSLRMLLSRPPLLCIEAAFQLNLDAIDIESWLRNMTKSSMSAMPAVRKRRPLLCPLSEVKAASFFVLFFFLLVVTEQL